MTYSSDLYSTRFDFPLLYKKLSRIYYSLFHKNGDDAFLTKSEYYENKYQASLVNTQFPIDEDLSGDVSEDELDTDTHQVVFRP